MAQSVQVRPISNDEGNRLLRIVRRGTGSVVTWRRAQMVLLSVQKLPHHPQQPTTLGDGGQPVLPPAPAGPGVDRPRPTWTWGLWSILTSRAIGIGRRWAAAAAAGPPSCTFGSKVGAGRW